ncbi:hypothetical protein WJX74_007120 [Apatococcus lobatus]|uniref:Methyltransferase domain-containing protein n=1 Tax=Apatococcus lobatus TaxID=904363 RepID=A0AAW1Q8N5_9CHLO
MRLLGLSPRPFPLSKRSGEQSLQKNVPGHTRCSAATAAEVTVQSPATKQVPYWIGKSGPISQAINAAINTPAIWSIMRMGARNAMTSTAEKAGIPWKQTVTELQACEELEKLRSHLVDPDFIYPEYADRKFHAYDGGNLDWQAVWEVEPATAATAVRVFKNDNLDPAIAMSTMRQSFTHAVQDFCRRHGVVVQHSLDAGCAGGESTRWLADAFPSAHTTGVDISAHFLALAELRRRQADTANPAASVEYMHASAESLPMADCSLDLITGSYLLHELPASATQELLQEAHRVLRPGGVVAVIDGDPWSDVHQQMPLPIATLMKSTEPYLDEYFSLDLEAAMRDAGFRHIEYLPVNHRHRVMIGCS